MSLKHLDLCVQKATMLWIAHTTHGISLVVERGRPCSFLIVSRCALTLVARESKQLVLCSQLPRETGKVPEEVKHQDAVRHFIRVRRHSVNSSLSALKFSRSIDRFCRGS